MSHKIAYVDAQGGLAGDMLLGALVGLGVDPGLFEEVAASVGLEGVKIEAEQVRRSGITAWHVEVRWPGAEGRHHGHHHRHLAEILSMLETSGLPGDVVQEASEVFRVLGRAEARVHGTSIEEVHFHEAGAVDSIVDVVGTVAGFHHLGVGEVMFSPIPVGTGTITFSHGTHGLPAPAVGELLTGMLVTPAHGVTSEVVTPTGAALAKALSRGQGPMPPMKVLGHGRGGGTRDHQALANILRIFVGEPHGGPWHTRSDRILVEAAVDDMNPQLVPLAFDRLFEAGAEDVHLTPIVMKKGRPAHLWTVLCPATHQDGVLDALFRSTTTIGCRIVSVDKVALERARVEVPTRYGTVEVKSSRLSRSEWRPAPEFDSVVEVAAKAGVEPMEVVAEVYAALRRGEGGPAGEPDPSGDHSSDSRGV